MTQHSYCGVSFKLITGDELGEAVDAIQDRWGPGWRDDPVKRLVMDTADDPHKLAPEVQPDLVDLLTDQQVEMLHKRHGAARLLKDAMLGNGELP